MKNVHYVLEEFPWINPLLREGIKEYVQKKTGMKRIVLLDLNQLMVNEFNKSLRINMLFSR